MIHARRVDEVPQLHLSRARHEVDEADELVVVRSPDSFGAVGRWYADFRPVSEREVVHLLRR